MGWAKFYEDNVSICFGRETNRESVHACFCKEQMPFNDGKPKAQPKAKDVLRSDMPADTIIEKCSNGIEGRRGLELVFTDAPEERVCRSLQMNGWWWSKKRRCWCNSISKVNINYARQTSGQYCAKIKMVTVQ